MKKLINSISIYIKNHPKTDLAILFAGLAIFVTIAIINAPRASIWFDEAFSAYIAQFSFWDIARYTASDVHPPFYYWLLKIWTSVFGTNEIGYRSLSILFGAAATTVAFFLSRKLFGRKIAWLSLLFIVLSPMLIRYSDEARMYTLVTLIVMSATYVLVKAEETNQRKYWIWYGILVSLGMWTHYFTALAWLAHLAWHGTQVWKNGISSKELRKRLFTKPWVITYAVAVGLFIPWIPFMVFQLGVVQGTGFWIGPVTINTPANYLTNYFYYLEHEQVHSWLAFAIIFLVIILIAVLPKVYKAFNTEEKRSFLLISALAWVPPALLFLSSLPPLRSSFVERYLVPSTIALSIFIAIILVKGTQKWRPFWRVLPVVLIVAMMIFGITNVYKYGNFNKNTSFHIFTREVVDKIKDKALVGEVIVAQTPWVFYESIPYTTSEHPIYYLGDTINDNIGSLMMLKENEQYKITDLQAFKKAHPTIWFIGQNENGTGIPAHESSWKSIQTISIKDDITGKTIYQATEYNVE